MSQKGTALVTGGSSGIGLEIARVLARQGYTLGLVARSRDTLDAVAHEMAASHGVEVRAFACDLSEAEARDALWREIEAAGLAIDVLVNNAGFGLFGPFRQSDLEAERRMIELNVTALVTLTKRCVPGMIARGHGRVLNVASTAAFLPGPAMSVYYATKAFVLSFSEAIGDELRETGVTVTALCPGPTATRFQAAARMERSRLMQSVMMSPAEVAEAGVAGMHEGRAVVVPGLRNRAVPWLVRLLPRRLVTAISRRAAEVG